MPNIYLLEPMKKPYGQEFLFLASLFFLNDLGFIWLGHIPDYFYNFGIVQLSLITYLTIMISRPDRGTLTVAPETVPFPRLLFFAACALLAGLAGHYAVEQPLSGIEELTGWFSMSRFSDPNTMFVDVTLGFVVAAAVEETVFRKMAIQWLETVSETTWLLVFVPAALFGLSHWGAGIAAIAGAFCYGAVATLIYLKVRRLWPVILANYATDVIVLGPESYSDMHLPF